MNFPLLSSLILLPTIGSLFIFFIKPTKKNFAVKYVAIFISTANFFLSLYLWILFDNNISTFQFVESKNWILNVHWPNDENLPGMLQIEALIQMGALILLTLPGNKGKVVYVVSANNLAFKRKVLPGDRLLLSTKLISFKRGIAEIKSIGKINNQIACKAIFKIVLPDVAIKYKIG